MADMWGMTGGGAAGGGARHQDRSGKGRCGGVRAGLVALALSLAACSSASTPDAYYGLSAPDPAPAGGVADRRGRSVQVLVPQPRALQALDTASIAVVDAGPVYTYFPKAAWTDTLPKVVQAKIVRTLENTRGLRGVGLPGEGLLIDYQLQTDLRAFELHVDGRNRAVVEVMARLVNDRNGRTRASRVFSAEVPASGTSVAEAVRAMNAAADSVLDELAAWVLANV